MRNKELNLQEKAFFIYIQGFGEKCFQNQTTICEELCISKPTLRKLMKSLEEKSIFIFRENILIKQKRKLHQ